MILEMLAFGAAAVASGPGASMAPATATTPADVIVDGDRVDPEEKVCEKVVLPGSRLVTKRVCETRAQWMARRRGDREVLEDMLRRALQSGGRKP